MKDVLLRASRMEDVESITKIYTHYVLHSASSFETDPPDEKEMLRRRAHTLELKLPYLVAEIDGVVTGYAYATPYRPRAAYRYTVENSVYIHADHARKGLGRLLLTDVIRACEEFGARQMVAVIGDSGNVASIGLHLACGFRHVGVLNAVGFKFGRWVDTVLMQRQLSAGASSLPV